MPGVWIQKTRVPFTRKEGGVCDVKGNHDLAYRDVKDDLRSFYNGLCSLTATVDWLQKMDYSPGSHFWRVRCTVTKAKKRYTH